MIQTNESPKRQREIALLEAFRNRLTVGVSAANLDTAIYQDKHSLAQNPVYLAIASQKHCENSAFGSLTFKKDQILFCKEWITVRPLTATTDIALNGDGWKNEYRPLMPMSGKWGFFTLNKKGGYCG